MERLLLMMGVATAMLAAPLAYADALPSTSLYVQNGLIGHLDAIENGGAGAHETAPATWTDLTGNQTFTCVNGSLFTADAWVGNLSRYITASSAKALAALKNKAFTLEMVISHPASAVANYENWAYFGDSAQKHRYLVLDIRKPNSATPLVQGLQYRMTAYDERVPIADKGFTEWGKRQYLAITCSGTSATLYCDGTNVIQTLTNDSIEPTLSSLSFGAAPNGTSQLNTGAEICAVRMTERVLAPAEILRNNFIDRVRFMGASATDGECGFRVTGGALQVLAHMGGFGVQFSTDGGTTWQNDAIDVWTAPGAAVSFSARIASDGSSNVFFDSLPAGATVSGGTVTFSADAPAWIVARTPTSPSTSLYVQDGLIGHLDAIENGGSGTHIAAPSTWKDLTGNHVFACVNGAAFSSDAWVANGSSSVKTTSLLALNALKKKAFTLEMVIMHPESPVEKYEKWAVFGNDSNRQLTLDIRTVNSSNPVVQGLQYRANTYSTGCEIPDGHGTTTAWNRRQCLSITCDGNNATLYCDGTNAIHVSNYGTTEPALKNVSFGDYSTTTTPLSTGAEICAVRMISRVLSEDERRLNRFLDGVRFLGESATDGSRGYRIANGEVEAAVSVVGEGVQFSPDGGATWVDDAIATWQVLGAEVSLDCRVKNGTIDQRVLFADLPDGVKDIGGRLKFTMPSAPLSLVARIACRPATSYYVQDGLIGHLDAVENGGTGVHSAAPSAWTDLTGNHTFTCANGSAFAESAWVGNGSRYITSTSAKSLAALKNKKFTLEMMIAHPESPVRQWEFWSFFGDSSHRQLTTEIRTVNSVNPLIGGNQYRANGYNTGCEIPDGKGKTTSWNRRHYLAVTCDGNNATLYCDGTNALHVSKYGTTEPTLTAVTFGANSAYGDIVQAGAEICSVRMTERVLTGDEIMRNRFLDAARFKAVLPDESCGYKLRESDGALLVNVTAPAVENERCHLSYSLDGVEWSRTLDGWVVADSEVTVRVRSSNRHYGPTWAEQTIAPSAPQALSVEMVELPPLGMIIRLR